MKMNLIKRNLLSICFLFILIGSIMCNNKNNLFEIIFWNVIGDDSFDSVNNLDYEELIKKVQIINEVKSTQIISYYWDEQVIKIDRIKYRDENKKDFIFSDSGFFTVVFNKKIIYHGINRTFMLPEVLEYDNSEYPAVQSGKCSNSIVFLLLKPKYKPIFNSYKNFDKKYQKKIIIQEIYDYFNCMGKIINGKFDLFELCGFGTNFIF